MTILKNFEEWLNSQGWIIEKRYYDICLDNNDILNRYNNIFKNKLYILFLKTFSKLENSEGNKWFLFSEDFKNYSSDNSFAWNEFEIMSMESAYDEKEEIEIKQFWNTYIPFYLSTNGFYSYYAIDVSDQNYGIIVYGTEPIFEDFLIVAESFEDFLLKIINGTLSL